MKEEIKAPLDADLQAVTGIVDMDSEDQLRRLRLDVRVVRGGVTAPCLCWHSFYFLLLLWILLWICFFKILVLHIFGLFFLWYFGSFLYIS